METITPEQLKKKYSIGNTSQTTKEVLTPDEIKSKYKISKSQDKRDQMIEDGQAVSVNPERANPTLGGQIVRGAIKPFARLATNFDVANPNKTEYKSKFLGTINPIGYQTVDVGNRQDMGEDVSNKEIIGAAAKTFKEGIGNAAEISSYAISGGGASKVAGATLKGKALFGAGQGFKAGTTSGALSGFGQGLQEDKSAGEVIGDTLKGGGIGGITGGAIGGGAPLLSKGIKPLFRTSAERQIADSAAVDDSIRKALEGTTGDVAQIEKTAYGSKKALERLSNELPDIKVPDSKAPLGSGTTKQFDPSKATGNEWISAINSLAKKAVGNARTAVKEASRQGFTLRTDGAKKAIGQAVDNGEITYATAERLYKQIDNTGGDAEKIFDWVQDVNTKYKNKFEKGTIDDMATSRIANDIAEQFRKELNTVTDRTGYAEAISNISDLKKLLVSVARKANKGVNFGDITSEAGLDAGISLLTGNPAYMARTLASGVFKGIIGKFKNTQGLRSVTSAIKGISKTPNDTKMPSTTLKKKQLLLPEPGQTSYKEKESIKKFFTTPKGKTSENMQEAVDIAATEKKSVKTPKSGKSKAEMMKLRDFIESNKPYIAEKDLPVIKTPKRQKRLKDMYSNLPSIKY